MTPPVGTVAIARQRARAFCERFGLRLPILMAPMAGACPASLAIAVANAGGMGAMGALTTQPAGIADWVAQFRAQSNGSLQLNLWIPEPGPVRDAAAEAAVRDFLAQWGPAVPSPRNARPCSQPRQPSCRRSWGSIRRTSWRP
jgi:nitronate monooxygenase